MRGAGVGIAALALAIVSAVAQARALAAQGEAPASLTLEEALAVALRNNPGLQASRNDLNVADWDVRSAYGSWLPSAQVSSGLSWQGAGEQRFGSVTLAQLGFEDQPSYLSSSYNLGVSFSVDGRTLLGPGQAKRNREGTRAQIRAAEATLRLGVTKAYLEMLRQTEGLTLSEQELARAEANLRLAQARQAVGAGNVIDVQQAEVNVGRAQVTLIQSRTGVQTSRIRLLQQLGVDLSAEPSLETTFSVAEPSWTPDDLYEQAIGGNPDLQALRALEGAARYDVRMARSSYFPSVSLSAGMSGFTRQASSTAAQEAQAVQAGVSRIAQCRSLNDLVQRLPDPPPTQDCSLLATPQSALDAIRAENDAFPFDFTGQPPSVGMSISIPVFQGLGRQRDVERARAALADNRHRIREQELALRADIEARTAVVRTAFETTRIEERNQELADRQLSLARERYELGLSNFIDLVEAETVKARADRERIFATFTYHDAVADLEAVVGTPLRNP